MFCLFFLIFYHQFACLYLILSGFPAPHPLKLHLFIWLNVFRLFGPWLPSPIDIKVIFWSLSLNRCLFHWFSPSPPDTTPAPVRSHAFKELPDTQDSSLTKDLSFSPFCLDFLHNMFDYYHYILLLLLFCTLSKHSLHTTFDIYHPASSRHTHKFTE